MKTILTFLLATQVCWAASPASLWAVRAGQTFDRWTLKSSLHPKNKNVDPRGGAETVTKTMTATQMELFKYVRSRSVHSFVA